MDQEEYDSTIALAREFIDLYPDGTTFRWPLAQTYYKLTRYDSAAVAFENIRSRLLNRPGNYFNLVECDYHLARCYNWLENDEGLNYTVDRFQEYEAKIPEETRKKQRSAIRYLQRMVDRHADSSE